jgi:hypothetical protein
MKKYHTVYKVINKINNKIYIGVHSTDNLNDNYYGSGKSIRKALKKYGKENFEKRILFISSFKQLAYKLEKLLVTHAIVKSDDYYNMMIGGVNTMTEEERKLRQERMKINNPAFNMSEETKKKMSIAHTGKPSNAKGKFKIPGDGRFSGCVHKKENNPSANSYIIISPNDQKYIINLAENLKKFCGEHNLALAPLYISLKKKYRFIDESYLSNLKTKKKEIIDKYKNTVGWSVEVARTKDLNDFNNK